MRSPDGSKGASAPLFAVMPFAPDRCMPEGMSVVADGGVAGFGIGLTLVSLKTPLAGAGFGAGAG
jgi:hypothetical protein